MPTTSALQFAEQGKFSQVRAFAGDVLYTEGMPAPHMYVVKEGEVDLYLVRDEKRTVIETLRKGQCFGIEPHQAASTRVHNAAARTYCELYLIDNGTVNRAIDASADLVRSALNTLSERLSVAHELIARRVNYQPELLMYAQLLQLAGLADLGRQAGSAPPGNRPLARTHGSRGSDAAPQVAQPLLQDLITQARTLFGHSDRHIRGLLGKFVSLHLVRIVDDGASGKRVAFSPRDLVAQVRKIVDDDADIDRLVYEYLSLDEFAAMVDVDRAVLLKKLADGEFAEDIFTFRRSEIMRALDQKGRRYFAERKGKAPAEFADVSDIEFADPRSVFAVVSKMDTYDLAKVLHTLGDGDARRKILGALSSRRRADLEQDLKDLREVDPVEVQQLGSTLIGNVRATMLQQAA